MVSVLEKASEGNYVWHFQDLYEGDARKDNRHAESDEISIRYWIPFLLQYFTTVAVLFLAIIE